jgi:hypothetical protein
MPTRKRSRPHSFEDQLADHRKRLAADAKSLPEGPEKDAALQKIEELEIAFRMNRWLSPRQLT